MKHLTLVTGRRDYPVAAGHTPEEVAKFLHEMITLLGDAVGLMTLIEELRESKDGTGS